MTRRQNQHTPLEALTRNRGGEAPPDDVHVELASNHETQATDIAHSDGRFLAHVPQAVLQLVTALHHIGQHAFLLKHIQSRQRGRTSDSIAAVRATHATWLLRRCKLRPCSNHREGVARSNALRGHKDVWNDAKVLNRPLLPCPPVPALDLVCNEQDAVLCAPLLQLAPECHRRYHITALAEDRLNDHSSDLRGFSLLEQEEFQRLYGLLRRHAAIFVRVPCKRCAGWEWPSSLPPIAGRG
mmetsp:Transcript_40727/g.103564  ORF Transcript_40727/g.103564 Transcript_40727/m.103564 type:complete len:241 (-) Transcript_40727:557-1279(-)